MRFGTALQNLNGRYARPFPKILNTKCFWTPDAELRTKQKDKIDNVGYQRDAAKDLCILHSGLYNEAKPYTIS